jgi:NADPH:quinone reductase-like Zn-dependent oxidoreductase
MRAVRFHRHGGPEVLVVEDVPQPQPGPGEARVAVRAVALNHLDVWVRRGLPMRIEMPHVGGTDLSGEVAALGPDVSGVRIGDRVVAYPLLGYGKTPLAELGGPPRETAWILGEQTNGACCEEVVLPAANLLPMPDRLSFEEAAAIPVVFTTAWRMLAGRAALREGESVLVQGAGSGVGSAAIQIAKLLGARVIAATSTADKAAAARALGADEVVDYRRERVAERVLALTGKRGVDVVFEHVGGAAFEASLRAAAYGGRIVTCGATAGRDAKTNLALVFAKELSILGSTLGSLDDLRAVLGHVAAGRLRPVVDRVLPLEECRRGHELLEAGDHFGKIVLRV